MTRDTKIARAVRHALWPSAVAAAATIPAYAQDQDQQQPAEAQTVVVTGSRIVRQDYTSNSPITSVSDSAIKQNSDITLETALNNLPQIVAGGGTREAVQAEGTAVYKLFMSTLLDITDNIDQKRIIPPDNVVRHDDDDPYLVVAADKGTATFSDVANAISTDKGHWLGDAFASGGAAPLPRAEATAGLARLAPPSRPESIRFLLDTPNGRGIIPVPGGTVRASGGEGHARQRAPAARHAALGKREHRSGR